MLVLSRNVGQAIYIGDDIVIRITGLRGGKVLVGIEAPTDQVIYREELYYALLNKERANDAPGEPAKPPETCDRKTTPVERSQTNSSNTDRG
jgi:carbon storage regulator